MIFDYHIMQLSLLKKRLFKLYWSVCWLVLEVFWSLFNWTDWKPSFKQLIFQQGLLLQIKCRCIPGFSTLKFRTRSPENVSQLKPGQMSGTHVYLMHAGQFQIISVLGPEDLWIKLAFGGIPHDLKYMLRHLMLKISFKSLNCFLHFLSHSIQQLGFLWQFILDTQLISQYSDAAQTFYAKFYMGRGLKIVGLYLKWKKHRAGTDVAPFPFQSTCLGALHGYSWMKSFWNGLKARHRTLNKWAKSVRLRSKASKDATGVSIDFVNRLCFFPSH